MCTRKVRVWWVLLLALLASLAVFAQQPKSSDPDARIRYYRQRLGGRSTYPAYARLGLAYADKARATGRVSYYLDAARHLERSLAMQRNYEALLGLSGVSLALHRFPEALAYAREAVDTLPGDLLAQGALFDAQLGLGNHPEAERVLERMPAQSFAYLVRRAALREYRGDTTAALHDVEQACAQAEKEELPAATQAWCQVRAGALHLARCDPEKAFQQYQRAVFILPQYRLAGEHMAELDAGRGKTLQAMGFYQSQLAARSEPRYRMALADLREANREPRAVIYQRRRARSELLRRAAQDIRDAWHELALLEAADPKTSAEAVRWAEKDWRNRQDVHAAEALAWAWSQQGDRSKAEAALEQALAPGGASSSLLLHAALIRLRGGHADQARALFDRALACPAALTPADRRLAGQVKSQLAAPHH